MRLREDCEKRTFRKSMWRQAKTRWSSLSEVFPRPSPAIQRMPLLIAFWIMAGPKKSWGIFLGSSTTPNEIKRYFRTFLMVYGEVGNPLHFRYYYPRDLPAFLPTCDNEQFSILFGPVNRYWVEGEDRNAMIEHSFSAGQLMQRIVQLATLAESST